MPTTVRSIVRIAAAATLLAGCASHSEAPSVGTGLEAAPLGWSLGLPEEAQPEADQPGLVQKWLFGGGGDADGNIAPWSTRTLGRHGEQWYIAAGRRSGLRVGDLLEVREPGRLVTSPAGAPSGWIPGRFKGKLRIVALLGDDNAVAERVEGAEPAPEDYLLTAAESSAAE